MRKIILATVLVALSVSAGSGCKIFCRSCDSHYRPADLPVATPEPTFAG